MRNAMPTDWKTEPLPARRASIPIERAFTHDEMERIRGGLIPEAMEDKWFIYWKDDALHFHRSWTGFCIYVARFGVENGNWKMMEAEANRDPGQYSGASDEVDGRMISYLIDVLLLNRDAEFPCGEASGEMSALMRWSQVGRAMLGQRPSNDENGIG